MKLKNNIPVLLVTLLFLFSGFFTALAQKKSKANAKIKLGDELFSQEYYWDAVHYYREAFNIDTGNLHLAYKLAEAYYYSRDYKNGAEYYHEVMKKSELLYPLAPFKYADCLKRTGEYEKAKEQYQTLLKNYRRNSGAASSFESDKDYKKQLEMQIKSCNFALELLNNPLNVTVTNPGKVVNAAYTEASPFLVHDSILYFSSLQSDTALTDDGTKKYYFRLYKASLNHEGKPLHHELLPPTVNVAGANVANGCFSPDLKYLYFTECRENEKGKTFCAIYRSAWVNGQWDKAEKLPETINLQGYTSTHPTVGKYKGKKQALYFTSDMPGGLGGLDLWMATINEDGGFTAPQNLGKKINTPQDELTPFYDNETNILYFSSDGYPGLGGYDVFQSEGALRKWSDPVNMKYPLNSSVDDMYFMPDRKGRGGYFVSNRIGTTAIKSETCCDDIFMFQYKKGWPPKIAVEGFVYDEADAGKTYMEEVNVRLYLIDKDSTEFVVEDARTLKDILFFFKLNFGKNYRIYASKEGWFPGETKVSTIGIETSDTLHVEIPIKKLELNKSIVLKDIFYDFDKATLRPESKNTLDRLMELLYDNPAIIVELSSHTDSKGDDNYNIRLSQKRAESVVKYLLKAGIQKERLVAKGYGETTPIAPNANPDGSDNPEGRQLNRRTEIKVIGKLDATLVKEKPNIEEIMEKEE